MNGKQKHTQKKRVTAATEIEPAGRENKTESICSTIFRAILNGDFVPGAKLPAERELAESTGCSRVTVRRALEQLGQAGILIRTQGSGTYVATHSGGNSAACTQIALLTSVGDRFALEFIRALERELNACDILLVLRLTDDTPEKEEQAAVDLVGKGVHNLVIWPSGRAFPEKTFERLRVLGANMVFFDRMVPGAYADYVGLDNASALASLFAVADRRGLKKPVFVTHADLSADSDNLRKQAFLAECEKRGLPPTVIALPRKGTIEKRPDGIGAGSFVFCVNDEMALRLKTFVPAKQLFGIDGVPEADFATCRQPMATMARAAVNQLLKQQQKGERWKASQILIEGELIHGHGS